MVVGKKTQLQSRGFLNRLERGAGGWRRHHACHVPPNPEAGIGFSAKRLEKKPKLRLIKF
jgi:hypothetical protein